MSNNFEKLEKFQLMDNEMEAIAGNGIGELWDNIWNDYKDYPVDCGGTMVQRFNWFGFHGTDDITPD